MNKEIIAVVRLAMGEVGYYDDLSRIHLTASNPRRDIYSGTNCTQLRRSVKSGRLGLVSGSLGEEKKTELGKKGNKFTGTIPIEVEQAIAPAMVEPPAVEPPAPEVSIEPPTPEAPAEMQGFIVVEKPAVVDIASEQSIEIIEPASAEEVIVSGEVVIAEDEIATEDDAKKTSRKRRQ